MPCIAFTCQLLLLRGTEGWPEQAKARISVLSIKIWPIPAAHRRKLKSNIIILVAPRQAGGRAGGRPCRAWEMAEKWIVEGLLLFAHLLLGTGEHDMRYIFAFLVQVLFICYLFAVGTCSCTCSRIHSYMAFLPKTHRTR